MMSNVKSMININYHTECTKVTKKEDTWVAENADTNHNAKLQ